MSNIIVMFTTDSPYYSDQFFETLEKTSPDVGAYGLPAGDRSKVFNTAVKELGAGDPDDILMFCDDDIIWHRQIEPPESPFFAGGLLDQIWHHVPDRGWLVTPDRTADGWCIGIKRWLFEKVGGFDPNFRFSGFQDLDLSMACWHEGYLPFPWAFPGDHLGAGTKYKINPEHKETRLENMAYVIEKWDLPVVKRKTIDYILGQKPRWDNKKIWDYVRRGMV
jgi:hypothetical protein